MEHFTTQIKKNWLFIGLFVSMVLWYGNVNTRITRAEEDIADLKVVVSKIEILNIQVAQISTKIDFIKERVR
jgi:hypothetical protein